MKKLLLLLTALAPLAANATHLMGGNLIATHTTGSNYNLRLTYYRDTLGVPMYITEPIYIYPITNGTVALVQTATLNMSHNIALSTALVPNFPYGVEVGVYDTTISLLPGTYRILSNECCRNCSILNAMAPCNESITIYTDLKVMPANNNSSPDFLNMPIARFGINTVTTYNPLPYDVDADSIAWSLNVPMSGSYGNSGNIIANVAGFTTPPANTSAPFTMNPMTGDITWSPNTLGNFIQSFIVKEYRGGVQIGSIVRDMQYVVDAAPVISNFVTVTPYNTNTQGQYHYVYYKPGQQLMFKIKGTTQTAGVHLSMECAGGLFRQAPLPLFTTASGTSDVTGTFTWTPPAGMNKDQIIVFRLKDGNHANDFSLLMRRDPSTTDVATVASGVTSFTAYPNPASGTLRLQMELAKDIDGSIGLYNSAGQLVKTIYTGTLHMGTCAVASQLDGVAAGQYFIEVKSGSQVVHTAPVIVR